MIILELPLPPSVNHYYGYRYVPKKGVQVYIKPAGKKYREIVAWKTVGKHVDPEKNIRITLMYGMPDRRRRDVDNPFKCLFDALTHAGVYPDDSKIFDLHATKKLDPKKKGYVLVMLEEIDGGYDES